MDPDRRAQYTVLPSRKASLIRNFAPESQHPPHLAWAGGAVLDRLDRPRPAIDHAGPLGRGFQLAHVGPAQNGIAHARHRKTKELGNDRPAYVPAAVTAFAADRDTG